MKTIMACVCLLASTAAQAADPITFGFVTEQSGAWSFFGTGCTAGLQLGVQDVNAAGGALGRELKFITVDDQTDPAQAVAAIRRLDTQDQVVAVTGPTSSDTALAMYGYAEQSKLPFLVPVAAFPQLTRPGTQYTFRLEPDAVGFGYAMMKLIEHEHPGAKVAMVTSDYALMRAIAAGVRYQAPKSHLSLVSDVVFPQGSNDATVQAAQVVATEPDYVVVVGAGGFDNTITNTLLDFGVRPEQIVHPYGITTQVLGWSKRSVGSIYGTFFDHDLLNITPAGKELVAGMVKQFGRPASYVENFCYIVPAMFKAVLEKAGSTDRQAFRTALSQLRMTEPTSGVPIAFDANGARKEYMYFMRIRDVTTSDYNAEQVFYVEWDPDVLPVYELVK